MIRLNVSNKTLYNRRRISSNIQFNFCIPIHRRIRPLQTIKKMKFALISLLLAIGVSCISAEFNTTWGVGDRQYPLLKEKSVFASPAAFQLQDRTLVFPKVSFVRWKDKKIVSGIDYIIPFEFLERIQSSNHFWYCAHWP